MSQSNNVKIVIFVPESHADKVREAMGMAGAGKIGDYAFNGDPVSLIDYYAL